MTAFLLALYILACCVDSWAAARLDAALLNLRSAARAAGLIIAAPRFPNRVITVLCAVSIVGLCAMQIATFVLGGIDG